MSHRDLPMEITEQIAWLCPPGTLASLCLVSKTFGAEGERILYHTIFLDGDLSPDHHNAFLGCLKTLSNNPKKAALVHSLAVVTSMAHPDCPHMDEMEDPEEDAQLLAVCNALPNMVSLKFLSFRGRAFWQCRAIESMLYRKDFSLEALYISHIDRMPRLLQCHPKMKVVGLWDAGRFKFTDLARYSEPSLRTGHSPLVFAMQSTATPQEINHLTFRSNPSTYTPEALLNLPIFFNRHPAFDGMYHRTLSPSKVESFSIWIRDLSPCSVADVKWALRNISACFPGVHGQLELMVRRDATISSFFDLKPILLSVPKLRCLSIYPLRNCKTASLRTEAQRRELLAFVEDCISSGCTDLFSVCVETGTRSVTGDTGIGVFRDRSGKGWQFYSEN